MRAVVMVAVVAMLAGCGGGLGCDGQTLTDDMLCKLTCGQTSFEETKRILGTPTGSTSGLLDYRQICGADAVSYTFLFTRDDKLQKVSRTGVGPRFAGGQLPSCLKACE